MTIIRVFFLWIFYNETVSRNADKHIENDLPCVSEHGEQKKEGYKT